MEIYYFERSSYGFIFIPKKNNPGETVPQPRIEFSSSTALELGVRQGLEHRSPRSLSIRLNNFNRNRVQVVREVGPCGFSAPTGPIDWVPISSLKLRLLQEKLECFFISLVGSSVTCRAANAISAGVQIWSYTALLQDG